MATVLCFLSKGFDLLFYAVAIATVVGSCILLFTDAEEDSIIPPLLIANAVIFAPILLILLWNATRKRSVSPTMNGFRVALILLLVSPIPYLGILYGLPFKIPDSLTDILLAIAALSPIYTSFAYMVAGLFRDCILCEAKGCNF